MEKKYQFFISSTYEDLKEERMKVISAVLSMNQFPVGMEMFSAADEGQWQIIKETIDTSDFYILILGMRYGSIEKSSGISYTEKEFNYAIEQGIPILAFIIEDNAQIATKKIESDSNKALKLNNFKERVKEGRIVKLWRNSDDLATAVSQSIYKAITRANRPGWIRTTEVDIEKSLAEITRLTDRVHVLEGLNSDLRIQNNRKPNLYLDVIYELNDDGAPYDENIDILENRVVLKVATPDLSDAENGIDYKDFLGETHHDDRNTVKAFRYLYQNAFPLRFRIHNDGDVKATDVRIKLCFPKELFVLYLHDLIDFASSKMIPFSDDADEGWESRFKGPNPAVVENDESKFININELMAIGDIADLLDPAEISNMKKIFPGIVSFEKYDVKHKDIEYIRNVCILPTKAGVFTIKCQIICNEYIDSVFQDIIVEVK